MGGNLLQARDPIGLQCDSQRCAALPGGAADTNTHSGSTGPAPPLPAAGESQFRVLDQAPDLAPPALANRQWAVGVNDEGREIYYVWVPEHRGYRRPNGPRETFPGQWAEFQLSGGATANDDLDTIQDVVTLGGAVLFRVGERLFIRALARRVAAEGIEDAAGAGTRAAGDAVETLARNGRRTVLGQGVGTMTCAPTACAMVADTHGVEVAVETLAREMRTGANGTPFGGLVTRTFTERGIQARFGLGQTVDQLAAATRRGAPAVVNMRVGQGVSAAGRPITLYHAVVVDGVTEIRGVGRVVAIRDPGNLGSQYFGSTGGSVGA